MLYLQIYDSGVNLRAGIVSYVITSMQGEGLGKVYRLAERLTCTNHKVIKKPVNSMGVMSTSMEVMSTIPTGRWISPAE